MAYCVASERHYSPTKPDMAISIDPLIDSQLAYRSMQPLFNSMKAVFIQRPAKEQ